MKAEKMKRVLITGGGGGLARACAGEFEAAGWEVLAPARDELDVANASSVETYFQSCGELDLLLCAAGKVEDVLLARMSEDVWDSVMEVNLNGAFRCARAASRSMLKRRSGQVIFISSHSAFHPHLGQAHYAAAKAGLVGMAKSLAREWGARSLRVNVVVPGFLETKMTEGLSEKARSEIRSKHMLSEFNTSAKVAKFILFLEEEMSGTSGQVFHLDSRIV